VNQGVRTIGADFVLLLNPDAVLQTGLDALRETCENPGAGAAGGKLVDTSSGSAQAGFAVRNLPTATALAFEVLLINRVWPGNPVNWHYRCYRFDYGKPAEVEQPAGAFLMFRRDAWEKVGGFDEQFYPIWFEDVDFCKRLRDDGYHVYYDPRAAATHLGGHSIQKILLQKRELYWYGSLLKYGFKHFAQGQARLLCLAVLAGSLLRMPLGILLRRSFQPIAIYGRVMQLAFRYMLFGPL
jgi:GT2 family glycosyltransferase